MFAQDICTNFDLMFPGAPDDFYLASLKFICDNILRKYTYNKMANAIADALKKETDKWDIPIISKHSIL
jgi:hypothetical protein